MKEPIFMDYHSTTPVDPRVVEVVAATMLQEIGNASSVDHVFGQRAAKIVENARRSVADLVGALKAKVIFTSGATEALNLAINHVVVKVTTKRPARLALLPVEHSAVLDTCLRFQKSHGSEVLFLEVDSRGRLACESLRNLLIHGVDLVCIMAANNEIGNVYPINYVAAMCANATTPFLCDASQGAGRIDLQFDRWLMHYLVISGHKMYGPKGIGALIAQRGAVPGPLLSGGTQEFGSRPGTLNVPAIAGLAEACRLRRLEMDIDEPAIAAKRDRLQRLLEDSITGVSINGDLEHRLAGNLHVSVGGIPNDAVISRIREVLAISRGAACSSGIEKPSHVLQALCLEEAEIEGALRIGIGKFTTDAEIDQAATILAYAIAEVQKRVREEECQRV